MFGLSYKAIISIAIFIILTLSTLVLKLLPDVFQAKDFLVYQVWLVGIWIFIICLPRKVGSILDLKKSKLIPIPVKK